METPLPVEMVREAARLGRAMRREDADKWASEHIEHGERGKAADLLYREARRISRVRTQRAKSRPVILPSPEEAQKALIHRRDERLITLASVEVAKRRLNTPTCNPGDGSVSDYDPKLRMWLINVEQRYHYSNAFGDWWVRASWLVGRDDGSLFAVRVPGTITTISAALDWITPAEVRKAQTEGRRVERQGDIFFVEQRRDNLRELVGTRHEWNAEARRVVHPDHGVLDLSGWKGAKAIQQTQLTSSHRGSRRRGGD